GSAGRHRLRAHAQRSARQAGAWIGQGAGRSQGRRAARLGDVSQRRSNCAGSESGGVEQETLAAKCAAISLRGRGRAAHLPTQPRCRCDSADLGQTKSRPQLRLPRRRTERRTHRRDPQNHPTDHEEVRSKTNHHETHERHEKKTERNRQGRKGSQGKTEKTKKTSKEGGSSGSSFVCYFLSLFSFLTLRPWRFRSVFFSYFSCVSWSDLLC